jgi:hypothetical protein
MPDHWFYYAAENIGIWGWEGRENCRMLISDCGMGSRRQRADNRQQTNEKGTEQKKYGFWNADFELDNSEK